MNLFFRPLSLIMFMGICHAHALEQEENKSSSEVRDERKDGVCLAVRFYPQYAHNRPERLVIGILLWNTGEQKYRYEFSGKAFDPEVIIRLIAPSGHVLTAYKDMPGAQFPEIRAESMHVGLLDGRGYNRSFGLSEYYPINEAGEYRCTISKRVYREEPGTGKKSNLLGVPVDLITPEFRFRLDSTDPAFRSPLADKVPALRSPTPVPSLEYPPPAAPSVAAPSKIEDTKERSEQPPPSVSWLPWLLLFLVLAAVLVWLAARRKWAI